MPDIFRTFDQRIIHQIGVALPPYFISRILAWITDKITSSYNNNGTNCIAQYKHYDSQCIFSGAQGTNI